MFLTTSMENDDLSVPKEQREAGQFIYSVCWGVGRGLGPDEGDQGIE